MAAPDLPPTILEAQDRFVAAWGQMASVWGISRTMAEIHALLYITGRPLNTDEIMERLEISRGNASMSLRGLLDWGIVAKTHRRGDRKEYFAAEQDVWTMFRSIVRERMKREVDPLLASLYEIRDMVEGKGRRDAGDAPLPIGRGEAGAVGADTGEGPAGRSPALPRDAAAEHARRIDAMLDFLQTAEKLGQRFVSPSGRGLRLAASLLNRVS